MLKDQADNRADARLSHCPSVMDAQFLTTVPDIAQVQKVVSQHIQHVQTEQGAIFQPAAFRYIGDENEWNVQDHQGRTA